MPSLQFRERRELAMQLILALGWDGILSGQVLDQATLLANFKSGVVGGQAFANLRRINELFGFGKRRRIHDGMEIKEVITWVNKILRQYSLAVVRRGDRIRLTRRNGILEVIRRRNERGTCFADSAGILNQTVKRWEPERGLGDHLDAFLDD